MDPSKPLWAQLWQEYRHSTRWEVRHPSRQHEKDRCGGSQRVASWTAGRRLWQKAFLNQLLFTFLPSILLTPPSLFLFLLWQPNNASTNNACLLKQLAALGQWPMFSSHGLRFIALTTWSSAEETIHKIDQSQLNGRTSHINKSKLPGPGYGQLDA